MGQTSCTFFFSTQYSIIIIQSIEIPSSALVFIRLVPTRSALCNAQFHIILTLTVRKDGGCNTTRQQPRTYLTHLLCATCHNIIRFTLPKYHAPRKQHTSLNHAIFLYVYIYRHILWYIVNSYRYIIERNAQNNNVRKPSSKNYIRTVITTAMAHY